MNDDSEALTIRVQDLEQQINDLDLSLTTAIEHGDIIEDQLVQNNDQLQYEIRQRVTAESRLQKLVHLITQQKSDLEILVDTIVEHSDNMDFSWLEQIKIVEQDSLTDSLTNIANRRAFDNYYASEWKRAIRNNSPFSLIMFDVDFFKRYNDLHGHIEGDRCLKSITHICQNCLTRPADLLARYGGEEFGIILPDSDIEGAKKIASEILNAVLSAKIIHGDSSASDFVTISIGVNCCNPTINSDSIEFLNQTDQLLYKAKDSGRNKFVTSNMPLQTKPNKVSSYGSFVTLHDYQKLENLSLNFIPSAMPINLRWRNNGLSADFLADYMSTFFPTKKDNSEFSITHAEIISAVNFISNELLENVMKYTAASCSLPSGINLYLDKKTIIFESFNYITAEIQDHFIQFITVLQNSDPDELYIQRIEENAINNASAGLGFLTMINDYQAKTAWKFIITNKDHIRVSTQITLNL